MKLINVDNIKWQKGVFVNPTTDEPLPIIHKIATIEMLRDWQEEAKAIPLDKVKQAREEMTLLYNKAVNYPVDEAYITAMKSIRGMLQLVDNLIESEGAKE